MIELQRTKTGWLITEEDKSFNITKTTESYLIDGDYFVTPEELLNILTEIKISDELNGIAD